MAYQHNDHYAKQAKKDGYLARSVYKLEELDKKHKLFGRNTQTVLDIGCAPGSWSQYVLRHPHAQGAHVYGIDIGESKLDDRRMHFLRHDATDRDVIHAWLADEGITQFDAIISDMAPNTIGYRDIDAIRSMTLIEKTLYLYERHLAPDGICVIKVFMGPGFEEFVQEFKQTITAKGVKVMRPKAIRKESKECYVVKYR